MNKLSSLPYTQNQVILYTAADGKVMANVLFANDTFWLTQSVMSELFGVKTPAISKHLKNIYESKELSHEATVSKMEIVQMEGERQVTREIEVYNLDAVIAVGYRVNSIKATHFRIWATNTLREFIVKGFVLNDQMLKNGRAFGKDYFDENGNMTIRSGGTKAWRNNNPGNMIYNPHGFAVRHGAIGSAGGMAVFPSELTGRNALSTLLKSSSYQYLSIFELPEKYDKHNANNYRDMLLSISKLDPNKLIKNLSVDEFEKLQAAIERIEGWKEGKESFIDKWYITGAHKKHGVITEYCINQAGITTWFSKQDAIQLALEARLHATVVHMKRGALYLRPEHHNHSFTIIT